MSNFVNIFSENSALAVHIKNQFQYSDFSVITYELNRNNIDYSRIRNNYSIFIIDQLTDSNLGEKSVLIKKYLNLASRSYKSIFLFPYTNTKKIDATLTIWQNEIFSKKDLTVGVIYLGDPVLNDIPIRFGNLEKNTERFNFSPVEVNWVTPVIVKLTISMKAYGQTTALIGSEVNLEKRLSNTNSLGTRIGDFINASYDQVIVCPTRVRLVTSRVDDNKTTEFNKTLEQVQKQAPSVIKLIVRKFSLSNLESLKQILAKLVAKRKTDRKKTIGIGLLKAKLNTQKVIAIAVFGLLLYLAAPLILYFAALQLFRTSQAQYLKENPAINSVFLSASGRLNRSSLYLYQKNASIDSLKKLNEKQQSQAKSLLTLSDNLTLLNSLNLEALALIRKSLVGDMENVWRNYKDLGLNLDFLHSSLSFLQTDRDALLLTDSNSSFNSEEIEQTRAAIASVATLVGKAPQILGKDTVRRYAIILSDTNILMGGGGRIDSIGVVEVAGAKVNSISVYTAENLVNKQKGEIEPPGDFDNYFSQSNWTIVNGNWHLDFPLNATKIQRFLDDALDIQVDGILVIDNNAINIINKFNTNTINPEVKTEGEGSEILRSFLSAYSVLSSSKSYNNNKLLYEVLGLLQKKQILIYLNDDSSEKILENLGWAGKFLSPTCVKCFSDIIGTTEIAKTAGSQNITKELDLQMSFEEGVLKKRLTLYIKNQNNFDYEAVIKVLAPLDTGFGNVTLVTNKDKSTPESNTYSASGFKEKNVLVKLEPNQAIGLSYYLEQPLVREEYEAYVLRFVKQPGSPSQNISISLDFSNTSKVDGPDHYSLTEDGKLVYNTELSSDYLTEIKFLK